MDQQTLKLLEAMLKRALANVVTKDDAKKFLTKDDLKSFATKDDLKSFATKDDLKSFATKDDLKNFATKDDLKNLVTKDYLERVLRILAENITKDIAEVVNALFIETDKLKANKKDVDALEVRVNKLERTKTN